MKYMHEYRQPELARNIVQTIQGELQTGRDYRLMEFCGGHTHAIFRFGIPHMLPDAIRFIHGPGCPVCVLPKGRIDGAITLLAEHDVILCTYADLMRVPASNRTSLQQVKAAGSDIRMVYSTLDALAIARQNPQKQVVFFAIGFETTAPATAAAMIQARREGLANFSVYCNHVLTPAAMRHILDVEQDDQLAVDGILGPSHVSTIIGSDAYRFCADTYHIPIVIAGFEPLDVLQSTLMLIRQINAGEHSVENEYCRAVTGTGNRKAQGLMAETFALRPSFSWRGLGEVADSALAVADDYADMDAELRFSMREQHAKDLPGCLCPSILRGLKQPLDCPLFGKPCRPENPLGACMVSSEGACAAYWSYGRERS